MSCKSRVGVGTIALKMATRSKYRWRTLRGAERLPLKGKARRDRLRQLTTQYHRLNGPVTTRPATDDELAHGLRAKA